MTSPFVPVARHRLRSRCPGRRTTDHTLRTLYASGQSLRFVLPDDDTAPPKASYQSATDPCSSAGTGLTPDGQHPAHVIWAAGNQTGGAAATAGLRGMRP